MVLQISTHKPLWRFICSAQHLHFKVDRFITWIYFLQILLCSPLCNGRFVGGSEILQLPYGVEVISLYNTRWGDALSLFFFSFSLFPLRWVIDCDSVSVGFSFLIRILSIGGHCYIWLVSADGAFRGCGALFSVNIIFFLGSVIPEAFSTH